MEEKALDSESREEVIELLDIIPSVEVQDDEEVIELTEDCIEGRAAFEEAPAAEGASLLADDADDGVLELTDALDAPVEEESSEADACTLGESEEPADPAPTFVEEEVFLRLASGLEERLAAVEADGRAERTAVEERLDAFAQRSEAVGQDLARQLAAYEERFAAEMQSCEERFALMEQKYGDALHALEERAASAEEALAVLRAENESLRQELAKAPRAVFEDISAKQALEEMVAPMIEARLPDVSEADQSAQASADEEARRAVIETVDELSLHVSELEKRVADWEDRCEQESALAAARVIREEIAAMRAGAARMSR